MAVSTPAPSAPERYSLEGGIPPVVRTILFVALAIGAILLPFALDPISSLLGEETREAG